MKKLLVFLTLLLLGSVAFADTAPDVLNPDAVTRYTDMSVYYLSQLFGTVGNVLVSNESQMMGKLFYQLNWGIFLISSIVIFYSVLLGTIKLASEGVTMQPGKSALFSLVKLALGVSLVIPSASTGYCVMQEIVMQVVVKGVGLADSIWSAGLDYLDKGGSIWHYPGSNNPVGIYQDLLKPDNLSALLSKDKLASQIFQNEVCMVGSRDPIQITTTTSSNTIAADGVSRPYFDVQEKDDLMVFDFPGLNDDSIATGNACGRISWNIKDSCKDGSGSSNCAITRASVAKLIYALMPAAKQYYCYKHGSQDSCVGFDGFTNLNQGLSPYLVNSLASYYPSVKAYADILSNQTKKNQTDFVANAKRDGWIVAGRYYWDVMRVTRQNDEVKDLSAYTSPDIQSGPSNLGAAGTLKDIIVAAKPDFDTAYSSSDFSQALGAFVSTNGKTMKQGRIVDIPVLPNALNPRAGQIINPAAIAAVSVPVGVFNPGLGATLVATTLGINNIGKMFNDWASYQYNPIQFLYKVGQECIKLTLVIWIAGGAAIALSVLAYSICAAESPLSYGSTAVVEWVKPILMMIATMLWMAGFFLCYYVPIYPFMVFLFASFGWFISVIEAMVAAPLVALGMTHPESHDLLGKSEQAIMLLLSVFIQPSLLVLGLMAGIILSYVSFELLIYTFSAFVGDVMNNSGTSIASTTDIVAAVQNSALYTNSASLKGANILVAPVLLIVFCVITYTLLTQSFSLIYLLRDNVMKWLGAPTTGIPSVEQMLSDTRGAISQGGSRTGDAGSQTFGGSAGAAESFLQKKEKGQEKQNKEDEKKVNIPSDGGGAAGGAAM